MKYEFMKYELPGAELGGFALLILGLGIIIAGVVTFHKARTTVDPRSPEKAAKLAESGIYAHTRNPMYLGMALMLFAVATYLANPFLVLDPLFFVYYMNRYQIPAEEEALAQLFGAEYSAYRSRVRRWL